MVDLRADAPQAAPPYLLRLEGQAHPHDFEWIGDEDAGHAREGAAEESPQARLVLLGRDEDGADLLVCEEFNGGVGEDAEEGGGMAAEETTDAGLPVDVTHGGHNAEPGAGVFGELGVRGLEEDFDAVEGTDDGFGLIHGKLSVDWIP